MKNRRAHLGIEAKLGPFFICLDFVHLNEDSPFGWASSQNVQADDPSPCSTARLRDVHKVLIHQVPGEEQSPTHTPDVFSFNEGCLEGEERLACDFPPAISSSLAASRCNGAALSPPPLAARWGLFLNRHQMVGVLKRAVCRGLTLRSIDSVFLEPTAGQAGHWC